MTSLPKSFNAFAYVESVKANINQIISFIEPGEFTEWRHEYYYHLLQSLVTSSHFNGLSDEKKVTLMHDAHNIMFVLDIIEKIVTPEVIDHEMEVRQLISSLQIPNRKTRSV